jgi:hypothetical protein
MTPEWWPACPGIRTSVRQINTVMVPLDEVEYQVIERGPQVINDLSSQNRNCSGRINKDVKMFFAVRLRDDFVRVLRGVNGDFVMDRFEALRCPDEFEPCRL